MNEQIFLKRFNMAKSRRQLWDSQLDEAYDLFLPNRQTLGGKQVAGNRRMTTVYDSIGIESLQEYANNLKDKLLPSYQKWAIIQPAGLIEAEVALGVATVDERDELARQMSTVTDVIFDYIHASNFDQAAHEAIQDMAISTGALLCLDTGDVNQPIQFVAVPANELIPEATSDGSIGSVFREHMVAAREITAMYPQAESDAAISKIQADKPDTQLKVIEGTLFDPETGKYEFIVYLQNAQRKLYYTTTYDVSPWIIFRGNVAPGEVMGRGPALTALPSMTILNKLVSQLIYNNDMAITPPMMVNSASSALDISNISITPGSLLPTKSTYEGSQQAFQYLETRANFNIGMGMRNEYQSQIRNMFHLPMLGNIEGTTKSATEISIRNQQALSQQAALFGRLQQELVSKVISRVHYILSTYGIVPKELTIDGKIASVKASSPLARVQDAADIEGLMNFIQTSMSFGNSGMAMIASTLDTAKLGPYLSKKLGVPAELLLTSEQRAEIEQAMQQQMLANQPEGMPVEGEEV